MRLHALKRTYGPVLADFPACFFSTGQIANPATPRADTSGVRAQATAPASGAAPGGDAVPCPGGSAASAASEVRAQATAPASGAAPGPSGAVPCSGGSAASAASEVRAQATAPSSDAVPGGDAVPCPGGSTASAASEVCAQATAPASGAAPGPSGAVPSPGGSVASAACEVRVQATAPSSGAEPDSGCRAASTTSGAVPCANAIGAHLAKTSSAARVADSLDEAAPDTGSDGLCLLSGGEEDDDRSPASSLTESSIEDSGGITCRRPMNSEDAIRAVDSLFASVKKADIRQELGKPHTNAGEILPAGVDSLIDSIGYIDDQDIFLDVGCGLGNVLVQFALQTLVSKCYGIEMREEVLFHGLQLMDETPSLRDYCGKVSMVCAEASTIQLAFERPYSQATIILANHRLFEAHVKSHVEEQLGLHDSARVLILGEEVCPRHHASCRSTFCARWHSWKVISVPVSWTLRADLWIYRRKTN
ncbi:hypothetical protein DVH05_014891 [Phytophthora capsici]|nr:hypothetical protein DVH05_014891 [Phytophthora capsici]